MPLHLGTAGELSPDLIGNHARGGGLEVDRVSKLTGLGSSAMTFQPVGAELLVASAACTAASSSGAQASGISAYAGPW